MLSADHHHPIPASVLYFSHRNQASLPPEKRNRLIGLAQGILNFTAVLAHGLYPSPPGEQPQGSQSTQLRAVQSRNQKILFHQPEPGFHLCAVIKLPSDCNQSSAVTLKLSNTFSLAPQAQQSSSSYDPSETVLLKALDRGAQEYQLLFGSMSSYVTNREALVERLEKFWSVWLWRWNVGKTGCGGTDFDELFGALESPFLQPPELPAPVLDLVNRFIHHICPQISVLPIFLRDAHVLYLPPATKEISAKEIRTLTRYLLSLLGGSEATKSKQNLATSDDESSIIKRLSTFDLNAIINLPPKFRPVPSWESTSLWAHKAFTWASTSFVLPSNLIDHDLSVDDLDQQLRADMGLLANTSPKMIPPKSTPSTAQVVTVPPSPACRTPQRNRPDKSLMKCRSPTSPTFKTLSYPDNLLAIYPPTSQDSCSSHYPHNLQNLYAESCPTEFRLDSVSSLLQSHVDAQKSESPQSIIDSTESDTLGNPTRSPAPVSKHNPRSPQFNVECALADAMSERSIGNMGNVEFIQNKPSNKSSSSSALNPSALALDPSFMPRDPVERAQAAMRKSSFSNSSPSDHQPQPSSTLKAVVKRIQVYLGHGHVETEVLWIQHEGWMIALVADEASRDCRSSMQEKDRKVLIDQSHLVLQALAESDWPIQSSNSEVSPAVSRKKKTLTAQRFLIRSPATGMFHKHSSAQSIWLTKNDIWPGRSIDMTEVEITFALLSILSTSRTVGFDHPTPNTSVNDFDETYLRTNSGQWIVFKKFSRRHSQQDTREDLESFLILPSGFGTLIEADNEIRILERQCEKLKLAIL